MTGSDAIKSEGGAGDSWGTPLALWEEIKDRHFRPGESIFDPCPNPKRLLPSALINLAADGMQIGWTDHAFVNPPFSEIERWIGKAHQLVDHGKASHIVMLLPVRSDQPWWHEYAISGKIVFIRGRVNYELAEGGKTAGASFPSCLIVFEKGNEKICSWWPWHPECHKNRRKR